MSPARLVISGASRAVCGQRFMHTSRVLRAVTTMQMPAMSPTMKEGGIAAWKFKEGDKFSAGDVLLEIETDKATIDVEAQEDGVLGKIILGDGSKNVAVGKPIALLAEEGDDVSNLEVPKEDSPSPSPPKEQSSSSSSSASSSAPPPASFQPPKPSTQSLAHGEHPTHPRPLFPSVLRLLSEHGIADGSKIKGTGLRGMLTKGDVLAHLGLASSPLGTFKDAGKKDGAVPKKASQQAASEVKKVLSAKEVRMAIVANLLGAGQPKVSAPSAASYDDILADYLPSAPTVSESAFIPPATKPPSSDYFAGLF